VLNEVELAARVEVLYEKYHTVVEIEARTLVSMLRTEVLPAAVRFQTELAGAVTTTQSAGLDCEGTRVQLQELLGHVDELREGIAGVESAESRPPEGMLEHADHVRDTLIPAMDQARAAADALERVVPDDLWPLPTYAEMLFIR